MKPPSTKAYLVGAGPGDLGLVTLRAKQLVSQADLLIYDYLSNPEILRWAKPEAEKIYAGKSAGNHTLTQDQINELLVSALKKGKMVVRLKGGDPFVFGRGGEEAEAIVQAGFDFEIVPGISSAVAVPAYAGIPVTHRDFTSSFTVITGHEEDGKKTSAAYWKRIAEDPSTRIFLMSVERIRYLTEQLLSAGAEAHTPVAMIRWGTIGRQQTIEGTLETIADIAEANQFKPPAVVIIGQVVTLRSTLNWFERKPLFGQRIVVTRTRAQASVLSERLSELGAEILEIPTIKIVPQEFSQDAKSKLQKLDHYFDWIVFTSPNAVEIFFHEFFKANEDIRSLGKIQFATVGSATAEKLHHLHLSTAKQPSEFTVEALAAAFSPEEIKGRRFCLPHGNLSDPQLAAHLKKNGGEVAEWIIYRTEPETTDENGARQRFQTEGADWITFTSSSTVENWDTLHLAAEKSPRCVSIGPITSKTLRKLGYSIDLEANPYTIDGVVNALLEKVLIEKTAVQIAQ